MSTVVGVVGESGSCTGAGGGVEGVKPVRALTGQYRVLGVDGNYPCMNEIDWENKTHRVATISENMMLP